MNLIEFHFLGNPYSLNAEYIAAVHPNEYGCEIYMVCDRKSEQWNTDESYEEVLRMIREVTDG